MAFDDGLQEHLSIALPILQELGARATFYVVSGYLGRTTDALPYQGQHLGAQDVLALRDAGMEIGSHTRTHPVLARLSNEQIDAELAGSRQDLADLLGEAPPALAYPFGSPGTIDPRVLDGARRAGYGHAVSTRIGSNSADTDRFVLRRIPVYDHDEERVVLAKALGALDWLGRVQHVWLKMFPHHSTRRVVT